MRDRVSSAQISALGIEAISVDGLPGPNVLVCVAVDGVLTFTRRALTGSDMWRPTPGPPPASAGHNPGTLRSRGYGNWKDSDARLLASGKSGDCGVFYDRHLGAVTAYVGRRAARPELIFDFVAETFSRALENRLHYDPARGPAIGWLIGIARNLMTDAGRRGQVEATGSGSGWRRLSSKTSSSD